MCAKRKSSTDKNKRILFSESFYSDMTANEMLHGILIRSPFSSGKLKLVEFDANEKLPEGYTLITAKDIPGQKAISTFGTKIPFLCDGNIKYKGEPLGIIAGPDKKILEELSSKINIIVSEETKTENDAAQNEKEAIASRDFTFGNVEEIFSDEEKFEHIIEGKWNNSISFHDNKETEGCFCYIKGGNLHVFSPSNWISHLRNCICGATNFAPENVIITRTNIFTKNTNSMWIDGILAAQACVTALKTGKPVMLKLSRKEQQQFVENPAKVNVKYRTALDENGELLAIDADIKVDTGCFNPFSSEIINRFIIASCSCYATKNLRVKASIYSSKNPPAAINLATIDSQIFFAMESQIQKICEETKFLPLELRLKNLNTPQVQKKIKFPFNFAFGRAQDVLNSVCKFADFNRKHAVYRISEENLNSINETSPYAPPMRGVGLACAFEGSGYLGTHFNNKNFNLQVTLTEEKKVIVNAIPQSYSIKEIWTKQIMDALDVERKNISFDYETSTDSSSKENIVILPEALFGNISVKTHLLAKCLDSLKKKKETELPATVKKTLSTARRNNWDLENFCGVPFFSTAFGACAVEVEFDPCSYREKIISIHAIVDSGKILHVKAAENAVRQSIQKCLSTLVQKECVECPKITVQFAASEEEPKQLGHLIQSILPAAYASAISQSIGKNLNELPLKTDSLFKLRLLENIQEKADENSSDA
ncbi:MAG: xanthine dehydrogenase family protein [Treponema sp.]|nr:xanthine dehydrogenase family protein [Candidatus Treponema equifaecale]